MPLCLLLLCLRRVTLNTKKEQLGGKNSLYGWGWGGGTLFIEYANNVSMDIDKTCKGYPKKSVSNHLIFF